jgi:hypothetical protein
LTNCWPKPTKFIWTATHEQGPESRDDTAAAFCQDVTFIGFRDDQMNLHQQDPFLEIAVEKEGNLVITIEARKEALHLTLEQWEEILALARKYHQETLGSDADWP